jgi:hypothetical protein
MEQIPTLPELVLVQENPRSETERARESRDGGDAPAIDGPGTTSKSDA